MTSEPTSDLLDAHVVLLTNFIPPYRVPLLVALQNRVRQLTVLVSTPMEENRSWKVDTEGLDVRLQRTVSIRRSWQHPAGFSLPLYIHVPWSTPLELQRLRPDVVISAELGARSLLSASYCLSVGQAPLVVWATLSERTEQGRGAARQLVRRWLLRRATRVLVNGESGARYVRQFGVPSEKIDRIPQPALPGFEVASRRSVAPSKVRHLICAGQLTERKGLLPFIHQLENWCKRHPADHVKLALVGSGPLQPMLEQYEPSHNLEIQLVGECEPSALPGLYAEADALAFPTLADEWGLVVNEALAAGLPVLGSIHSQAVQELCADGRVGWLFDSDSARSMQSAINEALTTSPEKLAEMRAAAVERISHLTPDLVADRIAASLRKALNEPGAPATE